MLPTVPVTMGETCWVQPVLGAGNTLLLEKAQATDLEQTVALAESLEAPVNQGDEIGQLVVTSGGQEVATIPIVAGESVARLTYGQILSRFFRMALLLEPFREV